MFAHADGEQDNNFFICRDGLGPGDTLQIGIVNDAMDVCLVATGSLIEQDEWMTLIFRYDPSTNKVDVIKDGQVALQATDCQGTPADRTVSTAYVAKSHWSADPYANLELSGLVIVDGYLSDEEAIAAGRQIERGGVESSQQRGVISHQNYTHLESCRWIIGVEGADCAHAPIVVNFKKLHTASTMYRDYAFSIKRTLKHDEVIAGLSELRLYDPWGRRLVPDGVSNPGGNNPSPSGELVSVILAIF